jgi:hypothetical protein
MLEDEYAGAQDKEQHGYVYERTAVSNAFES